MQVRSNMLAGTHTHTHTQTPCIWQRRTKVLSTGKLRQTMHMYVAIIIE